jgi:hypothetical protein
MVIPSLSESDRTFNLLGLVSPKLASAFPGGPGSCRAADDREVVPPAMPPSLLRGSLHLSFPNSVTRLPSPQRLPVPQHTKRLRPKTYSVAVYLVAAVVTIQVIMVISVFWLRAMVVPVNVKFPKASPKSGLTAIPTPQPPAVPVAVAPKTPDLPSLPSLAASMPHPALLSVPAISDKIAQIGSLNDQAQMLMRQNDLKSGLDLLIKAEDIDPRNPNILKSLAEAYYLMNDAPRAKQYWQRLVDLGPGVGTVYGLARDHVLLLGNHEADALAEPSTLPRYIYIDQVEKTPVETLDGQPKFHLRTELKRKDPDMPSFDQKKLRPYVIFYQQMDDGKLVPDLGQHGGSFEDTFLFWGKKNKEAFGVDYIMPIPGLPGPNNTTAGEYYGFVIGIYYDNQLQDARSEPASLITRMPLPADIE